MSIEIKYDGYYPNLCGGNLTVILDGNIWKFPDYCLRSGGQAWTKSDYTGTTTGEWSVAEWPKGFPDSRKGDVVNAINGEIHWGCCGGCI